MGRYSRSSIPGFIKTESYFDLNMITLNHSWKKAVNHRTLTSFFATDISCLNLREYENIIFDLATSSRANPYVLEFTRNQPAPGTCYAPLLPILSSPGTGLSSENSLEDLLIIGNAALELLQLGLIIGNAVLEHLIT